MDAKRVHWDFLFNLMQETPGPRRQPKLPVPWLFWALVGAFLITLAASTWVIYSVLRKPPAEPVPGQTPQAKGVDLPNLNTPLQPKNAPAPHPWDGKSRINILLLGIDDRPWMTEDGPPRTDTIILATINPENKTLGMLALPRDLWVDVPGYGLYKINQAYFLGESYDHPTGGAGLSLETTENFLGVEIPYYIQINFNAFVHLVNKIGGVKIDVPEKVMLDFGEGNVKWVYPGVQTLPGDIALAYVRSRSTPGGDFDRMERQQLFLQALQQRVTEFQLIPTLISQAPSLYQEVIDGVSTNLTLGQIIKLARLSNEIPQTNMQNITINQDHVRPDMNAQGEYILHPIPEEIDKLVNAIFSLEPSPIQPSATPVPVTPTSTPEQDPPTPTPEPTQPEPRDIVVAVENGTLVTGLAEATAEYLQANLGVQTTIGNAERIYEETMIIDYLGDTETIATLTEMLNVPENRLYSRYDPDSESDILVILGTDWALENPLP